jgi:hypothetical protein
MWFSGKVAELRALQQFRPIWAFAQLFPASVVITFARCHCQAAATTRAFLDSSVHSPRSSSRRSHHMAVNTWAVDTPTSPCFLCPTTFRLYLCYPLPLSPCFPPYSVSKRQTPGRLTGHMQPRAHPCSYTYCPLHIPA